MDIRRLSRDDLDYIDQTGFRLRERVSLVALCGRRHGRGACRDRRLLGGLARAGATDRVRFKKLTACLSEVLGFAGTLLVRVVATSVALGDVVAHELANDAV